MFSRFKTMYEAYAWFRFASIGMLLLGAALLVRISGGFPPAVWVLLAKTMAQMTWLWAQHGPGIIAPLAIVALQALAYLTAWLLIGSGCVQALRHWLRNERERRAFARDMQEAQEQMKREQRPQFRAPTFANLPAYSPTQKLENVRFAEQPTQPGQPVRVGQPAPVHEAHQAQTYQTFQPGQYGQSGHNGHNGQLRRTVQLEQAETELASTPPAQWQRRLQVRLDVGTGWDVGIKRRQQPNEDSLIVLQGTCIYAESLLPYSLLVVADGMGGHAAGQEASLLAVQAMARCVIPVIAGASAMSDELLTEVLCEGVRQANFAVFEHSREIGAEMGTTMTAALVIDSTAYVVNVGDSRTYQFREGAGLRQITHDHSLVARLVAAGRITPDEVYTHPDRNQVYRGLGDRQHVEVDSFKVALQPGDRLLLCSDGLWEMVRNPEIERILRHPAWTPAQVSNALVRAALNGGGLDNISAIVAHVTPITI